MTDLFKRLIKKLKAYPIYEKWHIGTKKIFKFKKKF